MEDAYRFKKFIRCAPGLLWNLFQRMFFNIFRYLLGLRKPVLVGEMKISTRKGG